MLAIIHQGLMFTLIIKVITDILVERVCPRIGAVLTLPFQHAFMCDRGRWVQQLLAQNFPRTKLYPDVTLKEHLLASPVDLYVAGFPCQPFSSAGKGLGLADERGGPVLSAILRYLRKSLPKVFVLENVSGLRKKNQKKAFEFLLGRLSDIRSASGARAYVIQRKLLNSKNFGVAQSRPRVYILGVRPSPGRARIQMPVGSSQTPPLSKFLDAAVRPKEKPPQKTAKQNLQGAKKLRTDAGLSPDDTDMIIDLGSGRGVSMTHNMCPTITRTRGGARDYFHSRLSRRLSVGELLRLQGVPDGCLDFAGIPERQIGMIAGNAMTVPVLAAVIREGLLAAGLAREL